MSSVIAYWKTPKLPLVFHHYFTLPLSLHSPLWLPVFPSVALLSHVFPLLRRVWVYTELYHTRYTSVYTQPLPHSALPNCCIASIYFHVHWQALVSCGATLPRHGPACISIGNSIVPLHFPKPLVQFTLQHPPKTGHIPPLHAHIRATQQLDALGSLCFSLLQVYKLIEPCHHWAYYSFLTYPVFPHTPPVSSTTDGQAHYHNALNSLCVSLRLFLSSKLACDDNLASYFFV